MKVHGTEIFKIVKYFVKIGKPVRNNQVTARVFELAIINDELEAKNICVPFTILP